jgi:hypothetical protein
MSFDWRNFLEIARFFEENLESAIYSTEAASRCAINRAYYAAHHIACAHAVKNHGFMVKETGEDHGRLVKHFIDRPGVRAGSGMGRKLGRLMSWRLHCDYDDLELNHLEGTPVAGMNVTKAINLAQDVIDECRE